MEDALNIIQEIDKVLALGEKGLARESEARDVEIRAKNFLENTLDLDSELGREYDKWHRSPIWKTPSHDGFANNSYLSPLSSLRNFITKLLDESDVDVPVDQQYIGTGKVFTGRKALREILKNAKVNVDIQDNYIDQEIFAILEPYLENNSSLQVRILTSDKAKPSFLSDFEAFKNQFGRTAAKIHDQSHGRFVILDGSDVFSVGHSLKDIGKKADVISKITDDAARTDTIKDFEKWWADGLEIEKNTNKE